MPRQFSHCAPNVGHLARHEGDHFQPHYRMPFALTSGRKDGLFVSILRPLILWLSAASSASYANLGSCEIRNGNASSNPALPPASLNCREIPPSFPLNYAKYANFSRLLLSKPDCRERTARRRRGQSRLFSGGHIRSPVSIRALGECNAILSPGFGHSRLTFVGSSENRLRELWGLFL